LKRVLLYRFDRAPAEAIVSPGSYLQRDGAEIMSSSGTVQVLPYGEVKAICFASEPAAADLFTANTRFERRPKAPGLWARFTLRDGDQLEGMLSHNLLEWPAAGFILTPPRAGVTRQRVFLARAALLATDLLGVVGAAPVAPERRRRAATDEERQLRIFDR
jgi:hypothetical protein